jgi:hypothetical protein
MNKPLVDYTDTKQLQLNRIAGFKYLPQQKKIKITVIITTKPGK